MNENNNNNNNQGILGNPTVLIVLWAIAGFLFLLCPFIGSSNRRKICAARIRERRWNVDEEFEPDIAGLRVATERYQRAQAAENARNGQVLSIREEEEIRQVFLVEQMSKYTVAISSNDINMKTDCKMGKSDETESVSSSDGAMDAADIEMGHSPLVISEVGETDSDTCNELIVESPQSQQTDTVVTVPAAGESLAITGKKATRGVANGCTICISEFQAGDHITWAANEECPHVFHADCILNWMLAVGRMEQKRRRNHPDSSTGDPLKDAINFPMLCPCCRQQFVSVPDDTPLSPEGVRSPRENRSPDGPTNATEQVNGGTADSE